MNEQERMLSDIEIEEIIRKLQRIASALQDCVRLLEHTAEVIRRMTPEVNGGCRFEQKIVSEHVKATLGTCYKQIMTRYIVAYNHISDLFSEFVKMESEKKQLSETKEYIDVAVDERGLYVRLPRLPVKAYRRSNLFQEQLKAKLNSIDYIPKFDKKLIRIVHVFSSDYSLRRIPDNDNYDFKRITDIITDYIGGGDGGADCFFFLETIITDNIPEGSYIIVTNNECEIEPLQTLVKRIKKSIFST